MSFMNKLKTEVKVPISLANSFSFHLGTLFGHIIILGHRVKISSKHRTLTQLENSFHCQEKKDYLNTVFDIIKLFKSSFNTNFCDISKSIKHKYSNW